jgi:hypothetical protein
MVDITWNDAMDRFDANVTCEVFESIFESRLKEFIRPISLADIQARERGSRLSTGPIKQGQFHISDGRTHDDYVRVVNLVTGQMKQQYNQERQEIIQKYDEDHDINSYVLYSSLWNWESSLVAANAGRGVFFSIEVQFTDFETDTESNSMSVTMGWVYMDTSATFRQLVFPQLIASMSQQHLGCQIIQYISDIYNKENILFFLDDLIQDLQRMGITEIVNNAAIYDLQWTHMGRLWVLWIPPTHQSSLFIPPGSQLMLSVGPLATATERITDQIIYSLNMGQM